MIHLVVIQKGTTWWAVLHQNRKHDCTEIESIDAFLQVDRCKWDIGYYHFDGDPIYDTENDEREIAEFWPYEQPSLAILQEHVSLQVQNGSFTFKI
jgi:hypothetical protein